MRRPAAIIFDFDGVLVESVDVKARAFADLYSEYGPDVVAKVVAYHLEHGGVSRFRKFRHFHEVFLGKPLSPHEEHELGSRFARIVEDAVVASPWVPGAREFLERHYGEILLFVASATPAAELKRIIERREMSRYFVAVYGTPETKGEVVARILSEHRLRPEFALMIGDSQADYQGAASNGVQFIARAGAAANAFPPEVPVLPDLRSLGRLISC